jgi:hypothetical protein
MSIRILFRLVGVIAFVATTARADEMDPYRERFKIGYEKYVAGAVGEALQYWEPIYRELGPQKGYRLSYNIARAYETLGDATRAAERYESFLDEAQARKDRGEALEEIVEKEIGEARTHHDGLVQSKGRIRVAPTTPAETVQIDSIEPRLAGFTAYVPPGHHTITFAPGTKDAERKEIDIAAGQLVEIAPPPQPESPSPVPKMEVRELRETTHPYGIGWIVAAGSLTAASIVAPVIAYSVAQSQYNAIDQAKDDIDLQTRKINDYYAARTAAYVTLAIPLVLAATTAGLFAGYVFGAKENIRLVPVGAGASILGTF